MEACDKYKLLFMALMDNELTPEESFDINTHFIQCSKCRKEFDDLLNTSNNLKSLSFTEPEDEVLSQIWKNPFSRLTKLSGIIMIIGGWLSLIVYSGYEFLKNGDEALIPKISTVAMILGFLFLFIYILQERIRTYKVDKYKEVKR